LAAGALACRGPPASGVVSSCSNSSASRFMASLALLITCFSKNEKSGGTGEQNAVALEPCGLQRSPRLRKHVPRLEMGEQEQVPGGTGPGGRTRLCISMRCVPPFPIPLSLGEQTKAASLLGWRHLVPLFPTFP
jgi:hypothetical protein